MRSLLRNHGLSIALLGIFLVTFLGQILRGQADYNHEREQEHEAPLSLGGYLQSAHFLEAATENWESEFLQMGTYVLATAWLYQKGSAESRDPLKRRQSRSTRSVTPDSPWPARRGGWVLRIYEHSLSIALFAVFAGAFLLHSIGGCRLYNEERLHNGEAALSWAGYLASSRFCSSRSKTGRANSSPSPRWWCCRSSSGKRTPRSRRACKHLIGKTRNSAPPRRRRGPPSVASYNVTRLPVRADS